MTALAGAAWGWRVQHSPRVHTATLRAVVQAATAIVVLSRVSPSQHRTLAAATVAASLVAGGVTAARSLAEPEGAWVGQLSTSPLFGVATGRAMKVLVQRRSGIVIVAAYMAARDQISPALLIVTLITIAAAGVVGCAIAVVVYRAWMANSGIGVAALGGALLTCGAVGSRPHLALPALVGTALIAIPFTARLDRLAARTVVLAASRAANTQARLHLARLVRVLQASPSLTAALLWKGIASRSRTRTTYMRIAALAAVTVAYALAALMSSPPLTPAQFALLLAGGLVIDGAPSPLGAEGARIVFLRTAPYRQLSLLGAKIVSHWLPAAALSAPAAGLAGAAVGGAEEAVPAIAAAVGFAFVASTLATAISIFDIDPLAQPQTQMHAVLLEEVPLTLPRFAALHAVALAGLACGAAIS